MSAAVQLEEDWQPKEGEEQHERCGHVAEKDEMRKRRRGLQRERMDGERETMGEKWVELKR